MELVVRRLARHLRVATMKRSQVRCMQCAAAPSPLSTQPAIPTPPGSWPHPSTNSAASSYGERHSKRRRESRASRTLRLTRQRRGARWTIHTAQHPQQERPSTMWTGVVDAIQVVIWPLPLLLRSRVRIRSLWWTRPDSNRRPTRCKRVALPTELQVQAQTSRGHGHRSSGDRTRS